MARESTDVRAMFEREFLGAWDLQGRDVTVEIERVQAAELFLRDANAKKKKPVVSFKGTEKKLVLNKTNSETIATMYGYDTRKWVGQKVTLYPTTARCGRETVDAIRVRPKVPQGRAQAVESQPVDREMRERQNRAAEQIEEEGSNG
jgi:hypothetical protein